MITILAIGKKHEPWIEDGLKRYQERLRAAWQVEWVLLPHSSLESDSARLKESERILKRLPVDAWVVLLDETGRQYSSIDFAGLIDQNFTFGKKVYFIIGGAYGVSAALKTRADITWSLSKLVFPHQLVRLILIEQLYRAQAITAGHSYHHQ